eukprot:g1603.t1
MPATPTSTTASTGWRRWRTVRLVLQVAEVRNLPLEPGDRVWCDVRVVVPDHAKHEPPLAKRRTRPRPSEPLVVPLRQPRAAAWHETFDFDFPGSVMSGRSSAELHIRVWQRPAARQPPQQQPAGFLGALSKLGQGLGLRGAGDAVPKDLHGDGRVIAIVRIRLSSLFASCANGYAGSDAVADAEDGCDAPPAVDGWWPLTPCTSSIAPSSVGGVGSGDRSAAAGAGVAGVAGVAEEESGLLRLVAFRAARHAATKSFSVDGCTSGDEWLRYRLEQALRTERSHAGGGDHCGRDGETRREVAGSDRQQPQPLLRQAVRAPAHSWAHDELGFRLPASSAVRRRWLHLREYYHCREATATMAWLHQQLQAGTGQGQRARDLCWMGVPAALRPEMWMKLSGAGDLQREAGSGCYAELVLEALAADVGESCEGRDGGERNAVFEQIELDLDRTFGEGHSSAVHAVPDCTPLGVDKYEQA